MIRKNMERYLSERLLFFKRLYEKPKQNAELFSNPQDKYRVKVGEFEFRFEYKLNEKINSANLRITISPLTDKSKKRLENKFLNTPINKKINFDNLTLNSLDKKDESYVFNTHLNSIHDRRTYDSFFKNIAEPLLL